MAYTSGVEDHHVDAYNKLAELYGDAEMIKHLHKYLNNDDVKALNWEVSNIKPEMEICSNMRHLMVDVKLAGKPYKVDVRIKDGKYLPTVYRVTSQGDFLGHITKDEHSEEYFTIHDLVMDLVKQYLW